MNKFRKSFGVVLTGLVMAGSFGVYAPVLAAAHTAGTNVSSNGTVYMITDDGQRRPYTSAGAFLSYGFNTWATVVPASTEDMALPQGSFIPPRDGKIVCSDRGTDKGTCYLITNGKRAAFVSASVFTSLGFSFSKALYGDVSFLDKDADITNTSDQHRSGVLVNKNGTIYLISDAGLLGIPSMDVLTTWGYSASDAVTANASDSQLSQSSVIASRQGAQLSPSGTTTTQTVDESTLVQGYIDTYPDLPTATINAPQDGASVIALIKTIEAIPGSGIDPVYPYLTTESVEMLNSAPNLKKSFATSMVQLAGLNTLSTQVDVFTGGTQALYTENEIMTQTSYAHNSYWVCKKENGVWKWDLIGTWKYQDSVNKQKNPTGAVTTGTGTDDITVSDAYFTENPTINDDNTWLVVEVKNSGKTTIEKFGVVVYFNNSIVADETENYELQPTQQIFLAVPLDYYWSLDGVRKTPGQYSADIRLVLGSTSNEVNTADNTYTATANFQQSSAPVSNIVGQ